MASIKQALRWTPSCLGPHTRNGSSKERGRGSVATAVGSALELPIWVADAEMRDWALQVGVGS